MGVLDPMYFFHTSLSHLRFSGARLLAGLLDDELSSLRIPKNPWEVSLLYQPLIDRWWLEKTEGNQCKV